MSMDVKGSDIRKHATAGGSNDTATLQMVAGTDSDAELRVLVPADRDAAASGDAAGRDAAIREPPIRGLRSS